MSEPRTVNIYGESYTVKSDEAPEYIQEVAAFIDGKMRDIAGSGKIVTTDKIAILAALNIADEFFRARRSWKEKEGKTEARIEKLIETLKKAESD